MNTNFNNIYTGLSVRVDSLYDLFECGNDISVYKATLDELDIEITNCTIAIFENAKEVDLDLLGTLQSKIEIMKNSNQLKSIHLKTHVYLSKQNCVSSLFSDKTTGKTFPTEVCYSLGGKDWKLTATGVSTRAKFFSKVYSVAHYIQADAYIDKNNVFDKLFNDSIAKQLTLIWVNSPNEEEKFSAKSIRDNYEAYINNIFTQDQQQILKPQIDQFLSIVGIRMHRDDMQVIKWAPGGYIEVEINGMKKGEIVSADFAKSIWKVWCGPKSVVNRNQLVSFVTK